mgnify:CR=1 FL=1
MSSEKPELDFVDKLWEAANRLRGKMEASQYKHIVLPLIFLKYISDMFESRRRWLENAIKDPKNEDYYLPSATEEDLRSILEDRDEYLSVGVFYVPLEARWSFLMQNAMQPHVGKLIDEAMDAIEKENPKQLRGVLPKIYTQSLVPPHVLGELINSFSKVGFELNEDKAKDPLGRVYEYFIGQFAAVEGKKGGEFYTPSCAVRLLVEILEPFSRRVYDPACGSGGMFVQSWKFLESHQKDPHALSVYGQELTETTWRICKMNLAIRRIPSENIAREDTLLNDQFPDLKADFIITNPPFNMTRWGADRVKNDVRWKYGIPDDTAKNGGNYAWIQHYIHHLAPNGRAGFVMANGSLSCGGKYGEIRKRIVEDDLVDCIVALPPKLFLTTTIPACLWFLARNKDESGKGLRDRRKEILFIDARTCFEIVSKRLSILTDDHIQQIADTYRAWRKGEGYKDVQGFCKSVTIKEVSTHNYVLTPGLYVGVIEEKEDDEPFDEKMKRLASNLAEQFRESKELEEEIKKELGRLGYAI